MYKKRRTPAPSFKVPPPYNPMTGKRAKLGHDPDLTRVAMMQVVAEDTHDNYVVCRGFDPECEKFFEYEEGDEDKKGLNVAKPYGIRGTYPYKIGQVFAAAKPETALGETSGKAETTVGHPADLDEAVVILTDDGGNPIAWLDIGNGTGGGKIKWGVIQSANPIDPFSNGQVTTAAPKVVWVKSCLFDGTADGDQTAFTLKIPSKPCVDTSLFTGYVVGYMLDDAEDKVIVTDCYDDPIGTVKAWDSTAAIRDGWTELTGAIGRFLVGCETGETWDTPGDTGGADLNALTLGLQDHPGVDDNCIINVAGQKWRHYKLDGTGGTLNHRLSGDGTAAGAGTLAPPWYAVKWIKRTL